MKLKNINCILFDLDGVLIDGQPLQVKSTLEVLKKYIYCTKEIKSLVFETITTEEKLKILHLQGLIKRNQIKKIYYEKRKLFEKNALNKIKFRKKIKNIFNHLKNRNFRVGVVTNSNKKSATKILKKLQILKYLDILVTNGNNIKPKPNPEPYNYAMAKLKVKKKNTLIFEDSPVGLLSAKRTGAHYIKVNQPKLMSYKYIQKIID